MKIKGNLIENHQNLAENCINTRILYEGDFLTLKRDYAQLPDGRLASREYLEHPGAVMIIPIFDDGTLLIERQFRYPLKEITVEYPAGKLQKGEDPFLCAKRELQEETGYLAKEWYYLTRIHPVASYSTESIAIYIANGLTAGNRKPDEDEFLYTEIISLDQIFLWIYQGIISDAKTIVATMWLSRIFQGNWPYPPILKK